MLVGDLLLRNKNASAYIKQGDLMLTYKECAEQALEMASYLNNIILTESLTIAIYLPNSIDFIVSYFAILFLNRVIVPIETYVKDFELLRIIEYNEVDLIITDTKHLKNIYKGLKKYSYKIIVYNTDKQEITRFNIIKHFINKSKHLVLEGTENDIVVMLHTSGTTNNPKQVMLTHRNLISNIESNIESLKLQASDIALIALPMCFGYCHTAQMLTHIYLGASIVILNSIFLPKQFFQTVEKEKITNFTAVPSMLMMILQYRYFQKYNLRSLRYICFGGGKMSPEKIKELIEKFPNVGFIQTYGQTECSPRVTALLPKDSLRKIGSVGKAIPNVDVKIFDELDRSLPPNHIGEIVVQGSNIMKGYYKQEQLTSECIRNGWLHTGDLGFLDEEGYLYLKGRIRNIIISRGINICPEEIEQILLQQENVKEAIVFGEDNDLLGEALIAKVVLKKRGSILDIKQHCQKYLPDYKIPIRFEVVEKMPKTYNGKIKRR